MKSKKGFTLVEIIVVIAILIVIAGVFSVNMISTLNKNKEEENKQIDSQIYSAAETYVAVNPDQVQDLYEGYGFVDIPVGDLRDYGLLSEDLADAETGERIADTDIVRIRFQSGEYLTYEFIKEADITAVKAYALWAEDLYVPYNSTAAQNTTTGNFQPITNDSEKTSQAWCANDWNTHYGLYDTRYSNINNYSSVTSKMYLFDNSSGKMYDWMANEGQVYADNYNLEVESCNVNPAKVGQYTIQYKYTEPESGKVKKVARNVYVESAAEDLVKIEAVINNNESIILNANRENIPIKIVEYYKNGKSSEYKPNNVANPTVGLVEKAGKYKIDNFATDTVGSKNAVVRSTQTNSDGTSVAAAQASYYVEGKFINIVNTWCSGSSCYIKCQQTGNYVLYKNNLYRVFQKVNSTDVKIVYESQGAANNYAKDFKGAYPQVGDCKWCCNSGRNLYIELGQNSYFEGTNKLYSETIDSQLSKFMTQKGTSGAGIKSQVINKYVGTLGLLTKNDYEQIAGTCYNSNYLVDGYRESFWLFDNYDFSGTYNIHYDVTKFYVHNYAVDGTNGSITTKYGSQLYGHYIGDPGNSSHAYNSDGTYVVSDELYIRPTIQLTNPTVTGGDGSKRNPYVLQ